MYILRCLQKNKAWEDSRVVLWCRQKPDWSY